MRITLRERDDMLALFQQRSDVWTQSVENPDLWLRTLDGGERTNLFAVFFNREESDGAFIEVVIVAQAWDENRALEYLVPLLSNMTTLAFRSSVEDLLAEYGLVPEVAEQAALRIASLDVLPCQHLVPAYCLHWRNVHDKPIVLEEPDNAEADVPRLQEVEVESEEERSLPSVSEEAGSGTEESESGTPPLRSEGEDSRFAPSGRGGEGTEEEKSVEGQGTELAS